MTARTERNADFPSGKDSEFVDRPVTKPALAWAGSDTNFHNDEH